MNNDINLTSSHKVLLNGSLILLGVCANATFFSVMATLLIGIAVLGCLRNQPQRSGFMVDLEVKEEEKLPATRV